MGVGLLVFGKPCGGAVGVWIIFVVGDALYAVLLALYAVGEGVLQILLAGSGGGSGGFGASYCG